MNNEAPSVNEAPEILKLWICCHCRQPRAVGVTPCQCGKALHDTASYRRVDPPAAPDETDKALAQQTIDSVATYYGQVSGDERLKVEAWLPQLIDAFTEALATVRAEAFKESAESIVNEAGKVGQLMDLASTSARKEERAEVKAALLDYFKHFPCTCVGQPRTGGHFAVCPITIRDEVLGRLAGLESARGKVER